MGSRPSALRIRSSLPRAPQRVVLGCDPLSPTRIPDELIERLCRGEDPAGSISVVNLRQIFPQAIAVSHVHLLHFLEVGE